VSHVYSSPGTYHVTLNVADSAGYTSSVSKTITVAPAPQTASLAGPGVVHGSAVTFTLVCHGVTSQTCAVTGTAVTSRLVGSGSTVLRGGTQGPLTVTLNPQSAALLPKSKGYKLPAKVFFTAPGIPVQTVVFGYNRIPAHISPAWTLLANGTTAVRSLLLTGLPPSATVVVSCAGGGCPFHHSRALHPRGGKVSIERQGKPGATTIWRGLFGTYRFTLPSTLSGGARLAPGARVGLKITAPGWVGEVVTYRLGRGSVARQNRCVPPGARKPQACR
jgi:PKD repeat protein